MNNRKISVFFVCYTFETAPHLYTITKIKLDLCQQNIFQLMTNLLYMNTGTPNTHTHMTQFKCLTTWVLLLLFAVCVCVCMFYYYLSLTTICVPKNGEAFSKKLNEFIHCHCVQFFFFS